MDRLQEFFILRARLLSERFSTVLPCFLTLLEREWREASPLMSAEEQGAGARAAPSAWD
jgi:hypothetical protein